MTGKVTAALDEAPTQPVVTAGLTAGTGHGYGPWAGVGRRPRRCHGRRVAGRRLAGGPAPAPPGARAAARRDPAVAPPPAGGRPAAGEPEGRPRRGVAVGAAAARHRRPRGHPRRRGRRRGAGVADDRASSRPGGVGCWSAVRRERLRPRRAGRAVARDAAGPAPHHAGRPAARGRRGVPGRRTGRARGGRGACAAAGAGGGRGGRGRMVATTAQVVARCARWSVDRPYAAALREARDQPAPPAAMAGYSARLAVSTTGTGLVFRILAAYGAATAAVLLRLAFTLVAARRFVLIARRWSTTPPVTPILARSRARAPDPTHGRSAASHATAARVTMTHSVMLGGAGRPTMRGRAVTTLEQAFSCRGVRWGATRERAVVQGATARRQQSPDSSNGTTWDDARCRARGGSCPDGATGTTAPTRRTGPGGGAMTTICDLDPVVAGALSSSVGGSTVVTSLEALRRHLETDLAEDTVVLGPSVDQAAALPAGRPDAGRPGRASASCWSGGGSTRPCSPRRCARACARSSRNATSPACNAAVRRRQELARRAARAAPTGRRRGPRPTRPGRHRLLRQGRLRQDDPGDQPRRGARRPRPPRGLPGRPRPGLRRRRHRAAALPGPHDRRRGRARRQPRRAAVQALLTPHSPG